MSGVTNDPSTLCDSAKLDRILAQLTIVNSQMDSHDQRIARLEDSSVGITTAAPQDTTASAQNEVVHPDAQALVTKAVNRDANMGGSGINNRLHATGNVWRMTPPRPKINFPHYDGESDPLPWLSKCDTYFRGMRTWEYDKVWQASLHEGVTAKWFYTLERDTGGVLTWTRFSEFVHTWFGPPLRTNGMADLKELHRTGSVEEYQRQFLRLLCRCVTCPSSNRRTCSQMVWGSLYAPTSNYNGQPTCSTPCTWLGPKGSVCSPPRAPPTSAPATAPKSQVVSGARPATSTPSRPRLCRLSPDEIAAKRASGECYNSSEKYSPDHKCAGRSVFLLELED